MNRTQLYQLVWQKPMTRLAKDLGISDVGLGKACRRHGIPVPPRGHWAKLAAGKPSPEIPLPNPEKDTPVRLTLSDPVKRESARAAEYAKRAAIEERRKRLPATEVAAESRPHPMVRATFDYIARIPTVVRRYERLSPMDRLGRDVERPPYLDKGRRHIHAPNGLDLTVSVESTDWAVNIHDSLIKALTVMGCRFSMGRRSDNDLEGLMCERRGEKIFFTFSEGYRKHVMSAEEVSTIKKQGSWSNDWEWRPSGRFTWSVRGTEYSINHQCAGKQSDIETKLPEMIAACMELLESQPAVREARLSEEARRRREAEEREMRERKTAERRKQLSNAIEIAQLHQQEQSLREFISSLESRLLDFRHDFQPKLIAWLQVVREELDRSPPHLEKLAEAILQPYWRNSQPDWWPDGISWPEGKNS